MFAVNSDGYLILNQPLMQTLERIQRQGNADIKYKTDRQIYNQDEVWAYPKLEGKTLVGDCEDIAIYKFNLLVAAGVPKGTLLMTICTDPNGNGHCVLTAITDKRDYILCNNHPNVSTVMEMRHEGYKFLYRQKKNCGIDQPWDVLR